MTTTKETSRAKATRKSFSDRHSTRIKSLVVWLAVWGLLPASLAEWLIKRGGLRHV